MRLKTLSLQGLKRSFLYILLLPLFFAGCDGYNKLAKSSDYEKKLDRAKQYYDKGNFVKANALFEELIPVYKGTDKAEEIYFLFAYCNYYQGDYSLAQYHFKNYYRNFPNTKHSEECLFMNAYCYYLNSPSYRLDQTDTKNAMAELQNFIDQYPESTRIDSCNHISDLLRGKLEHKDYDIAKQYFNISDYKAAITSCKNFMKDFPESRYIDEMYFIIMDSYYLLAVNSLETKKVERLDLAIDFYKKFVDLYANSGSSYIGRAENVYQSCLRLKSNIIKQ